MSYAPTLGRWAARLSLLALLTAARPAILPTPVAADCQQRIAHAYASFDQVLQHQQRQALELHFALQTTFVPPGQKRPTTTTARFRLVTKGRHSFWSTGQVDFYQDEHVQVSIARAQRTILITAAPARSANVLSRWLSMRQEFQTQTTIAACRLEASTAGAQRYILAHPQPGSTMAGQVTSIAYWLNPRTDELRRLTLYYPPGYGPQSASLVLEAQRLKAQDAAVDVPALRQVFGPDNQLLPAYRTFTVQDQRRS